MLPGEEQSWTKVAESGTGKRSERYLPTANGTWELDEMAEMGKGSEGRLTEMDT